jgi:lysophospholipase L1-like esterase
MRSLLLKRLALSAGSVLLSLLVLEVAVRLLTLDRVLVENPFRDSANATRLLVPDALLHWRGRPGAKLPDVARPLNSRGFRNGELPAEKAPGVKRIAVLGDSCTFGIVSGSGGLEAPAPYPERLQELLDEDAPGSFEVINYGVIGYTTYHGLRLLQSEVLGDEPDILVIRFGWDDLLGSPTGRSYTVPQSRLLEGLELALYRSRTLGLLFHLRSGVSQALVQKGVPAGKRPPAWVEPDGYALHLARMVEVARAHGIRPVLLDAPAGPVTPEIRRRGVRPSITGFSSHRELLRTHALYQDVTRRVAAEQDVPFVETDLSSGAPSFSRHDLFHPNAEGHARIALRLRDEIFRPRPREADHRSKMRSCAACSSRGPSTRPPLQLSQLLRCEPDVEAVLAPLREGCGAGREDDEAAEAAGLVA